MRADERLSLAALLDDIRPLIMAARAAGENPRYVLLDAPSYDAVAALKSDDLERGMPIVLLGLEIVRADESAPGPRVF